MSTQSSPLKILIVDDHELVLDATRKALVQQYPEAQIVLVQTSQQALSQVEQWQPNLVIVDLSMPEVTGETAKTKTGLQLLKTLMAQYPHLNIVVQSAHTRSLAQLKSVISTHEGRLVLVPLHGANHIQILSMRRFQPFLA